MSDKNTLITLRELESTRKKRKDKPDDNNKTLILPSKETIQRSQSQYIRLPPIKIRKISKSNIRKGMYHQFKQNIDFIREEANEIKTSLNQINTKCRKFSKSLRINKTTQNNTNRIDQSRLNLFFNSNNTSVLSPITSCRKKIIEDEDENEKYRLRNFKVYPIEFKKKFGFQTKGEIVKFAKIIVNSIDFQMKYINDELNVIFENYEYFKRKYILNKTIFKLFKVIDLYTKKKINSAIEETCGLVLEIPHYILGTFYDKVPEFLGKALFNVDYLNQRKVKDEANCLIENNEIMLKAFSFLLSSQEMYQTLFPEVTSKELLIPYDDFNITRGYLERIRYNINYIMEIADTQIKNNMKDKKAIEKFEEDIGNRMKENNIKKEDCIKKISGVLSLPSLEDVKILRINNVLNLTKSRNIQENKIKRKEMNKNNSFIDSPLIKSLFKYFSAELQDKILALKSHQKKCICIKKV